MCQSTTSIVARSLRTCQTASDRSRELHEWNDSLILCRRIFISVAPIDMPSKSILLHSNGSSVTRKSCYLNTPMTIRKLPIDDRPSHWNKPQCVICISSFTGLGLCMSEILAKEISFYLFFCFELYADLHKQNALSTHDIAEIYREISKLNFHYIWKTQLPAV